MEQKSFIMYTSWWEALSQLSTEEKGLLVDAIFKYHLTGVEPDKESPIKFPFSFLKPNFEINKAKYQRIIERNRENGSKGGRPQKNPKNPVGNLETQKTLNDNDNDNDNVNENDNDNDNVNENESLLRAKIFKFKNDVFSEENIRRYGTPMLTEFFQVWADVLGNEMRWEYNQRTFTSIENMLSRWGTLRKRYVKI